MVVSIGWWTKSFHRKLLFFCKVLVWGSRLKMVVLTCWYLLSHMFKKMNPSKVTLNISPNVGGHFLSFPKGHVNSPSQKGHGLNHLECFFLTQCCVFLISRCFFFLEVRKKSSFELKTGNLHVAGGFHSLEKRKLRSGTKKRAVWVASDERPLWHLFRWVILYGFETMG